MKKFATPLLLFLSLLFSASSLIAQDDMKQVKDYKNIVRINLTNPLIFGERAIILGYERVVKDHQSFSINGGLASLPKFNLINIADDSIVQLYKSSKDKGFNITGDYRFYLAKENKYNAPHGLYIGPYASHVFMGRENTWNLNSDTYSGEVNTDFRFNMTAIGAQLGYQFILWKRVALDFVLVGPSFAWYSLSAKLDTNLDADDESALYEKIDEILSERFPGYTFVFDDVDFKKSGTTNTRSVGFRYTVHVGYAF